ncbi:MAG: hypothetical protein H7Y42_05475 [Chitinophagaceae bacterium]|nr:hypothetical protein [Chitinophagaceae bacterium]
MKDTRSLLLALLSVGLVLTWVYHFYDKANYSMVKSQRVDVDTVSIAERVRDSLNRQYVAAFDEFDTRLDSSRSASDSLRLILAGRMSEINRLKNEISSILKNPKSTSAELAEARRKMVELEGRVQQMRDQNANMEVEKQGLVTKLEQVTGDAAGMEKNMRRLDDENKDLREKIRQASVFMSSALHLAAIDVREDKEQETVQSKKADKFVVSFVVQNNVNPQMNAEVFVVVKEPDGGILQNSAWDSGSFETKGEGKQSYTRKVRFDYEKGEQKRLIFSLDTDEFQKGQYKMQVWHQGHLVGEADKTLR